MSSRHTASHSSSSSSSVEEKNTTRRSVMNGTSSNPLPEEKSSMKDVPIPYFPATPAQIKEMSHHPSYQRTDTLSAYGIQSPEPELFREDACAPDEHEIPFPRSPIPNPSSRRTDNPSDYGIFDFDEEFETSTPLKEENKKPFPLSPIPRTFTMKEHNWWTDEDPDEEDNGWTDDEEDIELELEDGTTEILSLDDYESIKERYKFKNECQLSPRELMIGRAIMEETQNVLEMVTDLMNQEMSKIRIKKREESDLYNDGYNDGKKSREEAYPDNDIYMAGYEEGMRDDQENYREEKYLEKMEREYEEEEEEEDYDY